MTYRQRIATERRERFTQLLRVLREIEAAKKPFDNTTWGGDAYGRSPWEEGADMGSPADAIGWACRDEWFQNQGLRYRAPHSDDLSEYVPCYTNPYGQYFRSWAAVEQFFHISENEATRLFDEPDYPRELQDVISVVEAKLKRLQPKTAS